MSAPRWLRRFRAGNPIRPPQRITAADWNRPLAEDLARLTLGRTD